MIWRFVEAFGPFIGERRYYRLIKRLAGRARRKSRARVIGITGSSGKSTAGLLLAHILSGRADVHKQLQANHVSFLAKSLMRLSRRSDFMVAEMAAYRAGQMKSTSALMRPDVAIVTMVDLEHKSTFGSREAVAAEKAELVAALPLDGLAILNADDPLVMEMAKRTDARVVTFGRSEHADYRALEIRSGFPERMSMTVEWAGGSIPLRTNFVGDHFWMPALAAVSTALELGVPPEEISARVATHEPLLERCGVVSIPNGPHFIVDSIKAPWHSIPLAIEVVARANAPRKRIVLGHISDYKGSNNSKYKSFYRWASAAADQVIFVGDHTHRSGASDQDREQGRFIAFATPLDVADYIRRTAIPGELILLKGSLGLHLERIALSWTRDVKCWIPACRKLLTCQLCGLYATPYEQHKRNKRHDRRKRRKDTNKGIAS